jgi:hypothetical protein
MIGSGSRRIGLAAGRVAAGKLRCTAASKGDEAVPVDETRAVARLPHLEIEIRHRKAPEEGAEYLMLQMKAVPDLDRAMAFFDPFRLLAAWASLNPWLSPMGPLALWNGGRTLLGRQRREDGAG